MKARDGVVLVLIAAIVGIAVVGTGAFPDAKGTYVVTIVMLTVFGCIAISFMKD